MGPHPRAIARVTVGDERRGLRARIEAIDLSIAVAADVFEKENRLAGPRFPRDTAIHVVIEKRQLPSIGSGSANAMDLYRFAEARGDHDLPPPRIPGLKVC